MGLRDQLLSDILEFCGETKMAESTFGLYAVNDGKFVRRLRAGRDVNTETIDKIHKFISGYRKPSAANPVAAE